MRDNTRRNRNIGTAKQGYGQNNKMKIAEPLFASDCRWFPERLEKYRKEVRVINDHEFVFIVEDTIKGYYHACSVDDVAGMISHVPVDDYGEMKYIVLRQPKRKEALLSPVWGRLIYSYEFEGDYFPAIILEAAEEGFLLKFSRKLSVGNVKEIERLKKDGYKFVEDRKSFQAQVFPENVRSTLLYRTLLHEFGHYRQYLSVVEDLGNEDEEFEEWEKRRDYYHDSILSSEKEKFAHSYADKLRTKLENEGIIPLEKKGKMNYDLENSTK